MKKSRAATDRQFAHRVFAIACSILAVSVIVGAAA